MTSTGSHRRVGMGATASSGSSLRTSARMQLMNDTSYGPSVFPSGVSSSSLSSLSSTASGIAGNGGTRSLSAAGLAVTAAAAAGETLLRSPLPQSPFGGSFDNFRRHRSENSATITVTPTRNRSHVVAAIPISSHGITPAIIPSSSSSTSSRITSIPSSTISSMYMPLPAYTRAPLSDTEMKQHSIRVARANIRRSRRMKRRSLARHTFRSPLAAKPDRVHKMYIRRPGVLPVISMHLASLHIQKLYRGRRARAHVRQLRANQSTATQPSMASSSPPPPPSDGITDDSKDEKRTATIIPNNAPASSVATSRVRVRRPLYARYFAETGLTHIGSGHDVVTPQYQHWAARRIQNQWRYWKRRRHATYQRYQVYTAAATSIQRAWRKYADVLHHTRELPQRIDRAARIIQRVWRSWTDKRIFQYFRKLIINRQHSDPVMLIKSLNPMEAQLVDGASGLYVRFRLGGIMFPPVIYYKIFTRTAVTDIGSFAPRDYSRSRKVVQGDTKGLSHNHASTRGGPTFDGNDQTHWYKRWENNGWRPISEKLLWEQDHVVTSTSEKRIDYHHNRLVRQVDLLKKRKRKKLLWVKKMYALGGAAAVSTSGGTSTAGASANDEKHSAPIKSIADFDDEDESSSSLREEVLRRLAAIDHNSDQVFNQNWEDEADDLLKWTKGLDFEDYNSTWFETATSRPADRTYREAFPAL